MYGYQNGGGYTLARRRTVQLIVFLFLFLLLTVGAEANTNAPDFYTGPTEGLGIPVENAVEDLGTKKDNIKPDDIKPANGHKLSTDLIQLIDESQLPPGQSTDELKSQMQTLKQLRPTVDGKASSGDMVYVYIYLKSSAADTHVIDAYAEKVTDRDEENRLAVAWVEVNNLEALTSLDAVRLIRTVSPPVVYTGSVTSEGDAIHRAYNVRSQYGKNGSGLKVGIISDGVDHWRDSVRTGDLPSNVIVLSNSEGGDEGTAMLEIVNDLAPGAQLYFHDCGANKVAFNSAIDKLVAAGCKVICDDIGWLTEPTFEDGAVARHVASVLEQNDIVYVSSAGNEATNHYRGMYYNDGSNSHDFSSGTSQYKRLYLDIRPGESGEIVLKWDDPYGASSNDYDLYIKDRNTNLTLFKSYTIQDGSGDPLEFIRFQNNGYSTIQCYVSVNNYRGQAATKTIDVMIYEGKRYSNNMNPAYSIFGHPAVPKVLAVGAIDVPNPSQIADYSSQGPVTIQYPSPEKRNKPDICGIAGVKITGAGGFSNPFYGTSAAAPHVAAIAALIWSESPAKTAEDIRSALKSPAVDLGDAGFDYVYGNGRVDALSAYLMLTGGGGGGGQVTSVNLVSDKSSPQAAGTTVTFTATAAGSSNLVYQFWYQNPSGSWVSSGALSSSNTFQLSNTNTGTYTVVAYAKDASSNQNPVQSNVLQFTFNASSGGGQVTSVNLVSDKSSPQPAGTEVTFKTTSTGIANPVYKYWVKWPNDTWETTGPYTTNTNLSITSNNSGTCAVLALAKEASATEPQAVSNPILFNFTSTSVSITSN